jgi:hypothetical protein
MSGPAPLQLLREVSKWLKTLDCNKLPKVPVGSETVSIEGIKAIEKAAAEFVEKQVR